MKGNASLQIIARDNRWTRLALNLIPSSLMCTFLHLSRLKLLLFTRSSTLRDLLSTVLNQLTSVRFSLLFLVAFQCAISFFCCSIWQKRNWRINGVSASENQASPFPRVTLSERKTLLYFPRAGRLIGCHVDSSRRICFRARFPMTCFFPSSSTHRRTLRSAERVRVSQG